MKDLHSGGCHCGHLRYRFDARLHDIAHCHCTVCRRTSGSVVLTWITVPLASFEWRKGEPRSYDSSATCTRYFCPRCGAQVALLTRESPDTLDVTIGTLDQPELAPADRHIWTTTRLPWLRLDEHLPSEDGEAL